jgi:hypothetical protein
MKNLIKNIYFLMYQSKNVSDKQQVIVAINTLLVFMAILLLFAIN